MDGPPVPLCHTAPELLGEISAWKGHKLGAVCRTSAFFQFCPRPGSHQQKWASSKSLSYTGTGSYLHPKGKARMLKERKARDFFPSSMIPVSKPRKQWENTPEALGWIFQPVEFLAWRVHEHRAGWKDNPRPLQWYGLLSLPRVLGQSKSQANNFSTDKAAAAAEVLMFSLSLKLCPHLSPSKTDLQIALC